jgi:adenine deaminase
MPKSESHSNKKQMYELMKVALGEATADLAIVNGSMVNVYTGEMLTGDTVLIKGDKIAYVGEETGKAIGSSTQVIDATGKTLIPGFIDGHSHMLYPFSATELVRFAMKRGTTTIFTETGEIAFSLGYHGIIEYLKSIKNQPIKIFATAPPMVTLSRAAKENALNVSELRKLLRMKDVIGLGEPYWAQVVEGDPRIFDLIVETAKTGKKIDGHTSGAKGNKLQAYIALGISSCHEPVTSGEIKERLRAGLSIFIREGEIRRELEAVAKIREEKLDLRRLGLCTDGLGPREFINNGHMDFVVQKAIDLGFDPIQAIQMATINTAQRFGMDYLIGGIGPGKYADIVIIPEMKTIRPEYVISNGQVVAQNGELIVLPRKHTYPPSVYDSIHLPRQFETNDFAIPMKDARDKVKVRVIDQVALLVTKEAFIDIPVSDGELQPDVSQDILKVATIEKTYTPGKTFVGLIRGIGLKKGAIATSTPWDCSNIIVVGCHASDMAQAVNRIRELGGGVAVCAGGKIIAEISYPVGAWISLEPMETMATKLNDIQRAAADLGCHSPNIHLTLDVLTTPAIPFLRITEDGLMDIRQNKLVSLVVD